MVFSRGWIVGALGTTAGLALTASTLFFSTRTVVVADPGLAPASARPAGVPLIREIGGRAPTPTVQLVPPTLAPPRGLPSLFLASSSSAAEGAQQTEGGTNGGGTTAAASSRPSAPQTSNASSRPAGGAPNPPAPSGINPRTNGTPAVPVPTGQRTAPAEGEAELGGSASRSPATIAPTPMQPRSKPSSTGAAPTAQAFSQPVPSPTARWQTPDRRADQGIRPPNAGDRRAGLPVIPPGQPGPFLPPALPPRGCPRPGC